jgi:hypothetical protein
MITIILCVALFTVAIYYGMYRNYSMDVLDWFLAAFLEVVAVCLGFLLCLGVAGILNATDAETEYFQVGGTEIYALEDNVASSGRYYIGSGSQNGSAAYFYVVEDDEWGHKIEHKSVDNCYIIYDNEGKPRMERWEGNWKNHIAGALTVFSPPTRYKFYVPEGTITSDINVDLK